GRYRNILIHGACLKCNSRAKNSFTYDPIPKFFNKVQIIPNPPPQSHYNIYLCRICEIHSHYGYECSQRVLLVYEPKPCYNQNISDNAYPHNLPGVTPLVDHHCCYKCGDSLNDFFYGNDAHAAIAITFDLPTTETEDSLKIGDEHLDTIPETESDEFIKSSVENLFSSLSKSEDLSNSECDVPACDDFTNFFNFLFDADYDFSSSDNESFFDEDISKDIYSNPLFDEEIISMKIDPHHFNVESDLIESLLNHDSLIISSSSSKIGEFAGELILLKTIPPGIDETDCDPEEEIRLIEKLLYDNSSPRPPKEFISRNSDAEIESFSSFPIPVEDNDSLMKEIDLSFTSDDSMSSGIENDEYNSNGDMLILEELLSNHSLSLLENESFHFDIPSSLRPPAKPSNDNSGILNVKVMGDTSEHDVPMLKLFPTQPTLISNQEKSPHLLSH
nr:hypothetical protein [Tanacetum cinerariifolium]